MGRRNIDNGDNIIDSRDVIARLEELRDEREELAAAIEDWDDQQGGELGDLAEAGGEFDAEIAVRMASLKAEREKMVEALKEWDDDNGDELKALEALNKEGDEATSEWEYGTTLVRETHFKEYVQDYADDTGVPLKGLPSWIEIDWDASADNLKVDYTEIDFDGVTYLVQS